MNNMVLLIGASILIHSNYRVKPIFCCIQCSSITHLFKALAEAKDCGRENIQYHYNFPGIIIIIDYLFAYLLIYYFVFIIYYYNMCCKSVNS